MQFTMYETYEQLCKEETKKIAAILKSKPDAMLCLAAGHTSLGIFTELIDLYRKGELSFAKSKFAAMDEWQGMSLDTAGSCSDFLFQHFLSQVDFADENISYANGAANDLDAECRRMSDFIYDNNDGLDYLLLGVGMNGHLALNEPGVDFSQSVHVTALDPVTQQVGKKYFDTAPALSGGITIGIQDIKRAKTITLCVNGEKKAPVLKRIMTTPVTNEFPATVLKELQNAAILCDKDAARELFLMD